MLTFTRDFRDHHDKISVTPHTLIDAIVTERGVIRNPDAAAMQAAFAD